MYGTKNQHTQCLSGKESTCSAGDLQEIRVPSLGQEDPLDKEMATHSSILAWEIPQTAREVTKESDTT